ncbi:MULTISPECIES: DNA-binding transcriptional regulator Fis [Halomonas]|uniref:Putative Fis-like DNA-binding protein n=3 Tax=Halomonas TaxID=2745 RepID=A0ABQ0U1L4_9GAMM|nr:Fis family transcriptional regulator [Halomonas salina]PSJ23797.1 DNA-binding transcriptional regulator Fis [Halomonas sp. ND22Bw]QFT84698.1 DNA-binding protein Fis [Halomonas sp. THAF12]GEK72242.1 putative Fis-like DNA-binding protein [Halomonas halophila]
MTSSQALDQNSALTELDARASRRLDEADGSALSPHGDMPLREAVDAAMRRYFDHLDGGDVTDLHAMVMAEVEAPLLASVLENAQGNQTRAAEMLGLNRGTLRKKLKHYGLI